MDEKTLTLCRDFIGRRKKEEPGFISPYALYTCYVNSNRACMSELLQLFCKGDNAK